MGNKIVIDPISRIEGHLAIKAEIDNAVVTNAFVSGEMFRGFEAILKGRDPLDAQQITQRICGVCPISHGLASVGAQEDAYGIFPVRNGRLMRNIMLAANYIQSHIIHFYHLSALDFVDITAILNYKGKAQRMLDLKAWVMNELNSDQVFPATPFLPRMSGDYIDDQSLNITAVEHYLEALDMRGLAHQLVALFGGKVPHATSIVPGGITEKVNGKSIALCLSITKQLQSFIDNAYLPDVLAVAEKFPDYFTMGQGIHNFLAYGVFFEDDDQKEKFFPGGTLIDGKRRSLDASKISEEIKYGYYASQTGLFPFQGETIPDSHKERAYSWIKAPRYDGLPMEVGPLARVLMAYEAGHTDVATLVNDLLIKLGLQPHSLVSVMGRHAARAIECKIIADRCSRWINALQPDQPTTIDFDIPKRGSGVGLTEAPRGALGHWISIASHKIENYQCVVPTTWNASPRDDTDTPGPIEQALKGIPVNEKTQPIEVARVVRSFDPCIACAVH